MIHDASSSKSHSRPRVLFLRSHSKICAYSFPANGLRHSPNLEFAQYPPFPPQYERKLHKLPQRDIAWQDLQVNLLKDARKLSEKLDDGYFDLALLADHQAQLTSSQRQGWRERLKTWGRLIRNPGSERFSDYAYSKLFPYSFQELCQKIPVCVMDFSDYPYLTPADMDLLKHCARYFKREMPYNRFVLYHQLFQFTYLSRAQKDAALTGLLEKVENIPLGIPDDKFHQLVALRAEAQDIDVFWVGRISSTMRKKAEARLRELAAKTSWKIYMPTERLSFQDYCRTVARSKVTVSVEGGGWDCDRHYEAVALGSIPLINRPTRDARWWHEMPEEIFFENSFANFALRIEHFLRDAALRQTCLHALEKQIRDHMLWSKIIEYMVTTGLNDVPRTALSGYTRTG